MPRYKIAFCFIAVVLILGSAYKMFFHHQETYQVGLARNQISGEVYLFESPGFNFSPPWVWVSLLDTRPTMVCITTSARAFNCKLARFNPAYYQDFVATEGWHYYWWYNRLSFNFGYNDEYRGFRDILRGYAFGVQRYSFIEVQEQNPEQRN